MKISEYTEHLDQILRQSGISEEEYAYRNRNLKAAEQEKGSTISMVSSRYYSLAHEIKALQFLKQFGTVRMAMDGVHEAGSDFVLNGQYQIECICSTIGEDKDGISAFGFENTHRRLSDAGKRDELLYIRFANSIKKKLDFYHEHIEKGTMSADLPFVIFLGLGALKQMMFLVPGRNGIEFTGILLGKDKPMVTIDPETRVIKEQGFSFRPCIPKWNGSLINSAIFCSPDYTCVSGILITGADLHEEYTNNNTWLFTNPYATHKIGENDFSGITYWKAGADMKYRAYRNGRSL